MTTSIPKSLPTVSAVGSLSSRNSLRLVSSQDKTNVPSLVSVVSCLTLISAIGDKNIVNDAALIDLFQSLGVDERIEFAHSVHRDEFGNAPAVHPYRLRIRVAAAPSQVESLKTRVESVVAGAFPGLHFVPGGTLTATEPCHVAQFALSGLIAAEKPVPQKFAPEWNQSATLSRLMNPENTQNRHVLPFPEDLPNWALSAPFEDPLSLPAYTEIIIRVHGFSLNEASCEALHKTLFRIQAGNFVVFHPDSPVAAYSAASQLQEPAVSLIRHWLQHPAGFAVDCVVRSSEPLSDAAQRRVIGDIFGKRPFQKVRSFSDLEPQALAKPEFSWAVLRGQGLPALVPAQSVLSRLAVARHFAAPVVKPPSVGSLLGNTVCGRRSSAVSLPFASRSRHLALFGATGTGKSEILTQLIAEDIADPNRQCGISLLDGHGGVYKRVKELISPEREGDVILVDTSDPLSTACLNPLEGMKDDPVHANFVVSELMSLIEMMFESKDTSGPMLRSNLRNTLLLSANTPGRHSCILDAVRLLEDTDYADYLLSKCKDRNVVEYWEKFKKTTGSENGYGSWAPYLMARLTPFMSSPIMKRLINRPDSTIDLGLAMQEKKIVLFNLNKGVLSDSECQVLGSVILSKFWAAALGRAKLPESERTPFHLYVDEFASFANDATPRLFSEARKFGLCLNVAFQSLSQLENRWGRSNVTNSVLGNTATKIMMRLGPADASTLEPYFKPQFEASDMTNLPDFHAVACMTDNNRPIPPFVFKAHRAVPDASRHVPVAQLEERSRQRYCVPIDQANRELSKLFSLDLASLGTKPQEPELELEPVTASSTTKRSR